MDRAQTRLLVVLSALVIAVGGALYFQGPPDDEIDPEATSLVWALAPGDVRSLRIEREDGVLRLEKTEETWFVREPFDARADDEQLDELVTALVGVASGIPVGGDAAPSEFGLGSPPDARVIVQTNNGAEQVLEIGRAAPVGFRTYVRAADGGIVAVNGDLNRPVQADAARFRDRRVFRFDPAAVREVTIASPGGTLNVRGEGKDWWLEGFTHADADRVDDLVMGLLDLRFDVVREGVSVEPTTRVDIALADGRAFGLVVGDTSGDQVLAVTTDGRGGTLWPDSVAQLGRGPSDVGWRTAFGIRMDEADRVVLTEGRRTVEVRRNGAEWTAEGIDAGAAYEAVTALSRVPIEYRRDPPPAPEPAEFTVIVGEGERQWTIEVGAPLGDGFRAARDPAGGVAYRIASEPFDTAVRELREPAPMTLWWIAPPLPGLS